MPTSDHEERYFDVPSSNVKSNEVRLICLMMIGVLGCSSSNRRILLPYTIQDRVILFVLRLHDCMCEKSIIFMMFETKTDSSKAY